MSVTSTVTPVADPVSFPAEFVALTSTVGDVEPARLGKDRAEKIQEEEVEWEGEDREAEASLCPAWDANCDIRKLYTQYIHTSRLSKF